MYCISKYRIMTLLCIGNNLRIKLDKFKHAHTFWSKLNITCKVIYWRRLKFFKPVTEECRPLRSSVTWRIHATLRCRICLHRVKKSYWQRWNGRSSQIKIDTKVCRPLRFRVTWQVRVMLHCTIFLHRVRRSYWQRWDDRSYQCRDGRVPTVTTSCDDVASRYSGTLRFRIFVPSKM